jgi:hypothetical protein
VDQKQKSRKSSHFSFETSQLQDLHLWMTTEEAAQLSGYDIQYVRRLARQGKSRRHSYGIGAVKKGRDWWIDVEVFTAYLNSMLQSEDGRAGPKLSIGKPEGDE